MRPALPGPNHSIQRWLLREPSAAVARQTPTEVHSSVSTVLHRHGINQRHLHRVCASALRHCSASRGSHSHVPFGMGVLLRLSRETPTRFPRPNCKPRHRSHCPTYTAYSPVPCGTPSTVAPQRTIPLVMLPSATTVSRTGAADRQCSPLQLLEPAAARAAAVRCALVRNGACARAGRAAACARWSASAGERTAGGRCSHLGGAPRPSLRCPCPEYFMVLLSTHGPTLPRPMVHQGRRGGTPGASVLVGGCALCAALPVVAVSVRQTLEGIGADRQTRAVLCGADRFDSCWLAQRCCCRIARVL
jgi:hypothetical protein